MAHLCSEALSRGEREVPRPNRPFAKNLHVTFCTSNNHLAVTMLTAPVGIEL
jgi:hypothetical protein